MDTGSFTAWPHPDFLPAQEGRLTYAAPTDPWPKRLLIHAIERLAGRDRLERRYRTLRQQLRHPGAFWEAALQALEVPVDFDVPGLKTAPREGPLVVIANHPFGVVDGLALCAIGRRLRDRYQILTNQALCTDPLLDPFLLPIDFAETREATRTNIATKQAALNTLREGGAVLVFPGGGIATSHSWWGPAVELPWKRFAARLVQEARATVVPVYFPGQNSRLFQIVSQYSLTIRLALVLHEIRQHRGRPLPFRVGAPIPYDTLASFTDRQALLDELQRQVGRLASSE